MKDQPLADTDRPDALRHSVEAFFAIVNEAVWELRVQLCTDLQTMPVEDATVEWPEASSPYQTVALLKVSPAGLLDEPRSRDAEDRLSFNPWHCLSAHRPLGNVMRARRIAYPASVAFRAAANGCPVHDAAAALGPTAKSTTADGT